MKPKLAVGKNMTKYPILATQDTTTRQALKLMKTFHIRHLPVVVNETIIGVVSERDLFRSTETSPVSDVMAKNPYVVRSGTRLSEVTTTMASEKYGSAVVVNKGGEVLGIFTTTDALKLLTWYLAKEENKGDPTCERMIENWFEWDA